MDHQRIMFCLILNALSNIPDNKKKKTYNMVVISVHVITPPVSLPTP